MYGDSPSLPVSITRAGAETRRAVGSIVLVEVYKISSKIRFIGGPTAAYAFRAAVPRQFSAGSFAFSRYLPSSI